MWLKYKHQWSSGYDKEFSWKHLGFSNNNTIDEEYLLSVLSFIKEEYYWSDHYRGIDYELVELPPKSVLDNLIKETEKSIEQKIKYLDKLKMLLDKTSP